MIHHFTCPYCWETISMQLEFSVSESYIQDCEVCCNPIDVKTQWNGDDLVSVETNSIGQ